MKKIMKAALLVMAFCLILTGCQYLPEIPFLPTEPTAPTEHVHTLIHMEGYEATCTVNGIIENWSCLECGKRFADAEATKEITFADIEIIAKHSYDEGVVTAPTCTEGGYTTYTCTVCGDSYKADAVDATGHTPKEGSGVVTNPTCTEGGYTTYTCDTCGESYKADATEPSGHTAGAAATCTDPQICTVCKVELAPATGHTAGAAATCTDPQICTVCKVELAPATGHTMVDVEAKDATCSADGYTAHKACACGKTEGKEVLPAVNHIDTNLDITCDFEGCTTRILPPADSKISLFTAKHMIIVSLSRSYYVEGVVTEILDPRNGSFVITDDAGDSILIHLPKNADGVSYSSWTIGKVVLGDTISVYGKPQKNTSSTTSATYPAQIQSGVLTVVKHEHSFSEPTCTMDGVCGCLAIGETALGHADTDKNNLCDRCQWNMKLITSSIVIRTDDQGNGVFDESQTFWTWSSDDFDVIIAKGQSTYTVYKTPKDYMQLKKLNTLTVSSKNGASIYSITISATNPTQLTNLKDAIGTAYEYTENADELSVTIVWNSNEDFVLVNNGKNTVYVNNVQIAYEKPVTTPDPETFTMADYVVSGELGGGAAVRQMGENITLSISTGWITSDTARVYQNAHAIIQSNFALSSIVINAGYKDSTFDVYVSEDGENWVLYGNYAYTSAYSDVTINFDAPTQYVKLDAANKQLRMKTISVVYA